MAIINAPGGRCHCFERAHGTSSGVPGTGGGVQPWSAIYRL